jgi:Tol biopolymer transport system component
MRSVAARPYPILHRRLLVLAGAAAVVAVGLLSVGGARAAFPGGNGKIAFVTRASAPGCSAGALYPEIATMASDGTGQSLLTTLWVMNADGSGKTRVTNFDTNTDHVYISVESRVSFSRDGSKLAFTLYPGGANAFTPTGEPRVYVVNVDGSGLTNIGVAGDDPSFSPDGSKLAFGWGGLYVVSSAGGTPSLIAAAPLQRDAGANGQPNWAPDGSQIVFTARTCVTNCGQFMGSDDIAIVNTDGTGVTLLTHNSATPFASCGSD